MSVDVHDGLYVSSIVAQHPARSSHAPTASWQAVYARSYASLQLEQPPHENDWPPYLYVMSVHA